MHENLTEKQIEFCEFYSDPTALTECLIPENFNVPQSWPNCKCIVLRPYQFAMQNYSYHYAHDNALSQLENRRIQKGAGDLYSIGARNLGKSLFLWIDCIIQIIKKVKEGCIASFDADHLKKVTTVIASFCESHKYLQIFELRDSRKKSVTRQPFEVMTQHGSVFKGKNEKVEGDNPGVAFHGLHYDYLAYEEFSYASDEGTKKRIDSGNSLGYIERPSGIPDLCIGSPLGKILKDKKKKNWIWCLPQYCREDWTPEVEEKLAEEHGGKQSASYKLNVEAVTLEGAYGFWDMARLKEASLNKKRRIKTFEIGKDTYHQFQSKIHVDRPSTTEQVYIFADVGFGSAPTEIGIIFFDGKKYKYTYNITLYRLLQEEQAEIMKFLYNKLGGAFIAIDATSDEGAMFGHMTEINPEHLLKVKFNENIEVDFERDLETGEVILDKNGNPVMREMNTREWAFQELPKLMYSGVMDIPIDEKFLNQFTSTIAKQTKGNKIIYANKTSEDHLHSAFEVFAICRFFNEFKVLKNQRQNKRCYGVFN